MTANIDTREYSRTISLFATGVTVVTVEQGDDVRGMTVNALSSVSFEAASLLFCANKASRTAEALQENDIFSISILGESQQDVSAYFAKMWYEDEPPAFELETWAGGIRIKGSIGYIGCKVKQLLDGDTHWIVLADVTALERLENPEKPLLYYQKGYRSLA